MAKSKRSWWWAVPIAVSTYITQQALSNPGETMLAVSAVARAVARTVESGHRGVIYRFGRFYRIAEPGLVWLVPWIDQMSVWPTRSTTLVLPTQRVESADGLVYEVVATFVLHIEDPDRAAIQVADVFAGARDLCALAAGHVLRNATRAAWLDRGEMNKALALAASQRLASWGVVVDDAAFSTFAPTDRTLRITQLAATTAERLAAIRGLGVDVRHGLVLLGGSRRHWCAVRSARRCGAGLSKV